VVLVPHLVVGLTTNEYAQKPEEFIWSALVGRVDPTALEMLRIIPSTLNCFVEKLSGAPVN
jgi:hypothetical protein